jgi:hypothetical protein
MQNEIVRLVKRAKHHLEKSTSQLILKGADKLWVYAYSPFAKFQRSGRTFRCFGQEYSYFIHPYNATWRNERAVEIPILLRFLKEHEDKRILELGNVSEYYLLSSRNPQVHEVVDKYENSPSVINQDFLDYKPSKPFQAFVSISTFEHIGWDEPIKNEKKVESALKHIASVIDSKGSTLVTFPLGYHPYLDQLVKQGQHGFKQMTCLIRVNKANDWQEVDVKDALGRPYGSKFQAANAIFVGKS